MNDDLLRELARAKAVFQLRAIQAVIADQPSTPPGRPTQGVVCAAAGSARSADRRMVRMDKPLGFMVDCGSERGRGQDAKAVDPVTGTDPCKGDA